MVVWREITIFHSGISKHKGIYFALLAFAVPLIVRLIPEILMGPFVIGFDPLGYYVPTMSVLKNGVDILTFFGIAPLFYILLTGLTSTGLSIVLSLKVISVLLFGLLSLSIYLYANKALTWSHKKSLLVALFATLWFVSLRVSFDLLRTELALFFLFIVLIWFKKMERNLKNILPLAITMVLVILSNQIVAVIMFAILLSILLNFYIKKQNLLFRKLIIFSIPAVAMFFIVLIAGLFSSQFSLSSNLIGQDIGGSMASTALFGFGSFLDLVLDTVGFFLFCYLPLIPFVIFGFRRLRNIQLKTWLLWISVAIIVTLVFQFTFFAVLPYRWILLLVYPFAFFVIDAIDRINLRKRKLLVATSIAIVFVVLSGSFITCTTSSPFPYFSLYPKYVPTSILQNTVPLEDCQDTLNAINWLSNNMSGDSRLLVHHAFYGWALLSINSTQVINYGYGNPDDAAKSVMANNSFSNLYLIWWVNGSGWYGQPAVPSSFDVVFTSGRISVFVYNGTF